MLAASASVCVCACVGACVRACVRACHNKIVRICPLASVASFGDIVMNEHFISGTKHRLL